MAYPLRNICFWLLGIFSLRLWLAAHLPLAFDEAYYWLWSRDLHAGYYDHPPMVAFVIRLGTMLFGDTELGVRIVSVLLAVPATWAVWRAAAIFLKDEIKAAHAALYLNLTLLVSGGTVIVTPDAPLLLAASALLYFLAKLWETNDSRWWIETGFTMGLGLATKYSMLFMGFGIFLWLLFDKQMRRWLYSPWPYLSGMLAIAVFLPVILWNAEHDYISFIKQFGRAEVSQLTWKYVFQVIPIQALLITPPLFILGCIGLKNKDTVLLRAMILPMAVYFCWHALHANVQGNWFMPIYPAFAIAAAIPDYRRLRQAAAPVGFGILLLAMLHVEYGFFPTPKPNHTQKAIGFGWNDIASQVESLHAKTILTSNYSTTGWLTFYLPDHLPVIPINEPERWENFAFPKLETPALYITDARRDIAAEFPIKAKLELLKTIPRIAHGREVEQYRVYLVTHQTSR